MTPEATSIDPARVAAASEAPRWVWALLGVWILSTGAIASVLAPVDPIKGSTCRAALTPTHRP